MFWIACSIILLGLAAFAIGLIFNKPLKEDEQAKESDTLAG